jgi:hypothetical protein
MAVNSGPSKNKTRLIDLLCEAAELSGKVGLYVEGRQFNQTLFGVIGGLQRSLDAADQAAETVQG